MSKLIILIISASLFGLLIISIFQFRKHKSISRLTFHILIIFIISAILYLMFRKEPTSKGVGENNEIYFVIILYIFMLLGMLANYFYNRFSKPKTNRESFDIGLFIAPIFASPIIFIPLLASLQTADIELSNLTTTKLMVFIVSFQNGFFWKEYFDNRNKEIKNTKGKT